MNIIYIATSFPKENESSTIYTDLAEELHIKGHKLFVVAPESKYITQKSTLNYERGFKVLRLCTGRYYNVGFLEKGITTLLMPLVLRIKLSNAIKNENFDLVLFESPPITNVSVVRWLKRKLHCKAYLMLKDIFPQNAVDLELFKKGSLVHRYFRLKEKELYKVSDFIGCMSQGNIEYIKVREENEIALKLELFPNTKKVNQEIIKSSYIRDKYNIKDDTKIFLFGGNMGKPQYLSLLRNTIIKLKDFEKIFFVFVGRGTDKYLIEKAISENNVKNAIILENLHRDEYEKLISGIDIGLIVLNPKFTIPNYPSRILSYMEFGVPVLAATDNISDIKELILENEIGYWVWSGDEGNFISKLTEISLSNEFNKLGINARNYIINNFQVSHSVSILENHYLKGDFNV